MECALAGLSEGGRWVGGEETQTPVLVPCFPSGLCAFPDGTGCVPHVGCEAEAARCSFLMGIVCLTLGISCMHASSSYIFIHIKSQEVCARQGS